VRDDSLLRDACAAEISNPQKTRQIGNWERGSLQVLRPAPVAFATQRQHEKSVRSFSRGLEYPYFRSQNANSAVVAETPYNLSRNVYLGALPPAIIIRGAEPSCKQFVNVGILQNSRNKLCQMLLLPNRQRAFVNLIPKSNVPSTGATAAILSSSAPRSTSESGAFLRNADTTASTSPGSQVFQALGLHTRPFLPQAAHKQGIRMMYTSIRFSFTSAYRIDIQNHEPDGPWLY